MTGLDLALPGQEGTTTAAMPLADRLGTGLATDRPTCRQGTDQGPRPEAVRHGLRVQHDSCHTERSSGEWMVREIRFQAMRSRAALGPAASTIEALLTALAVHGHAAASTQHQAMHALLLLSTRVLKQERTARLHTVSARKKSHGPVGMTREAVAAVLSLLDDTVQLVAKRLYGSGWRMMEALRWHVQDIAHQRKRPRRFMFP